MASPSRPLKTSQAGTIFPSRADTRPGAPARTTRSSTTRRWERPSGHAQLEQQLGEEDCAGVVCWQKPPGRTRIRWRCCQIIKGRCNERRWRSIGQEADGRVAAPPSPNGLVGLLYERSPKKCKEARGAQDYLSNDWMTTRTLTGTKTTTGTMRTAMLSSLPLLQRNGLDNDTMYNDMLQAALQLDRHRRS
jgi:hypothetical protein